MTRPTLVRALAPAKVNLRLEVLGRRSDGFHEVRTWMLALDRCDVLEARASASGKVRLRLTGEHASADVPVDERNLAVRAASAALEEGRGSGRLSGRDGVDLVLDKRIPSRAGLGGGSSDAAAAWFATGAALGMELDSGERILAELGSDCAFFAGARSTGSALCEGRGERVAPSPGPSGAFFAAVVVPDVECPTAAVYAALDSLGGAALRESDSPLPALGLPASRVRPFLRNDLEEAARSAFPDLATWRSLLDRSGAADWILSGSGSAFFGVYDRRDEAESALAVVVEAARRQDAPGRGLQVRGAWVSAPAGHGAKIVEVR